ncbi:MAG: hypothetical protein ABXS91_11155, partial [Sulfurimonas sp.]
IFVTLAEMGLSFIADEVIGMAKDEAEDFIEDKTGVKIDLSGDDKPGEGDLGKLKSFDAQLKVMAEKNRHEEAKLAHDMDLFKAEMEDRGNARDMQKSALSQDDLFSKRFVYYLASFWSLVGAAYIFLITFYDIPEENVRFADTVLGFLLGTIVATVINFFFGSSKGSKDKTSILGSGVMEKYKREAVDLELF